MSDDTTNSIKAPKEASWLKSHQNHSTVLQYEL